MPSAISGTDGGSAVHDDVSINQTGLARKLTCSAVSVVSTGVCLILLIQVILVAKSVPDWGGDTKQAMVELEKENILKLASDEAEYVTEIFSRVEEGLLQVRAFAGQALLEVPETMVVDEYVKSYPGLDQDDNTWDHSVWFISEFEDEELPAVGSSLEGLVNRSSLMDVPFRGIQRQHLLVYLATPDDPSQIADEVSHVVMQSYAGFDMEEAGYLDFGQEQVCDERFAESRGSYVPTTYDPRCRLWYQDAAESPNGQVIFTNPYVDAGTGQLVVTGAAPVLGGADDDDASLLMGVVGIDIDVTDMEASINDLRVIGDDGYAYVLAPGGEGEVAVHRDLEAFGGTQYIVELEAGVDEPSFSDLVSRMSEECTGLETYEREGDGTWLISWNHENASDSSTASGGDECSSGDFIVVVTVSESTLLKEFSETEEQIASIVALASVIMALVLVAFSCLVGCFAHSISKSITEPVNQLVHVVQSLNKMDFSRQAPGVWMVNDISSPEVEDLMKAFEAMTAVVKFANMTLGQGDLEVAQQNYADALVLFKKLGNDRGVSIVNNNMGTVHTLQAEELTHRAAGASSRGDKGQARRLESQARLKYSAAVTNYQRAIEDAEMLCTAIKQREEGSSPPPTSPPKYAAGNGKDLNDGGGEVKAGEDPSWSPDDVEIGATRGDADGLRSSAALSLQLANRKFNLALCLAAKSKTTAVPTDKGQPSNQAATAEARGLMKECVTLAAERQDALGDQRHLEYLLALAALERDQGPHRMLHAGEALDAAERVTISYRGATGAEYDDTAGRGIGERSAEGRVGMAGESSPPPTPLAVLRQRLLAARGEHSLARGDPEVAIRHWTEAVIGCGDRMDVGAVRTSLLGLRGQAASGAGRKFSPELLVALGLPPGGGKDAVSLAAGVDDALTCVKLKAASSGVSLMAGMKQQSTNVDLCFVMDCTGSMQRWIDQAKNKLLDIITQAKKDVANLNLRVAFVGYRDFGDNVQYEGPFDFHTEDELPRLLDKLKGIKAYGGKDFPEDVAGGLKLATELSWRSPVRLCILIADAPCHGLRYHGGIGDRYPKGCPNGVSPSKMLYSLQYELGVDFYLVRITYATDKMMTMLENDVAAHIAQRKTNKTHRPALRGTTNTNPKYIQHNLGSNDNKFLDAVVQSVKVSAGINLRIEPY